MAARGWTALLLLAAVFAMHGLQCSAAGTDHAAGHRAAPVAAASAVLLDGIVHTGAVSSGSEAQGDDRAPIGAGEDLWTLCLAVLAAGLAVLITLLLPRLLTLLPAAWARLRTHASAALTPLRPPDLHSLCLLRI